MLLLALAACSSLRLAYGNASQLTWWWLDGYVDFSREQTPAAQQAIDRFFDWHRRTQLADTNALLRQAQAQMLEPTTPAAVCRWYDEARARLEPSLQQALLLFADLVPGLGEAQLKHLEARYAKNQRKAHDEYLQADAEDRLQAGFKRSLERAEDLYGPLDEPQRRVLREGVAASPFNPQAWLAERQRRQHDAVQTLRRLVAERGGDAEQRLRALRAVVQRFEQSPDAEYRAYQQRVLDYNCALAARVHNATTPEQRQKARQRIGGWELDLKSFLPR